MSQRTSKNVNKSKPAKVRLPVRYSLRASHTAEEILVTTDLEKAVERAEWYASVRGWRCWVWNIRTGETIHRTGGEV